MTERVSSARGTRAEALPFASGIRRRAAVHRYGQQYRESRESGDEGRGCSSRADRVRFTDPLRWTAPAEQRRDRDSAPSIGTSYSCPWARLSELLRDAGLRAARGRGTRRRTWPTVAERMARRTRKRAGALREIEGEGQNRRSTASKTVPEVTAELAGERRLSRSSTSMRSG